MLVLPVDIILDCATPQARLLNYFLAKETELQVLGAYRCWEKPITLTLRCDEIKPKLLR
jgi:hypothetical protein